MAAHGLPVLTRLLAANKNPGRSQPRTPAGELEDRWEYIPQAFCWARTDYPVRSVRDLALHAQTHASGFYRRFGFVEEGPEFMEAGIPHRTMVRSLPPQEKAWG